MGQLSLERMQKMDDESHLYFDWLTVLSDAGIRDVQDLNGQYLLKCPYHEDEIPSFRIRVREHNYHCFACNAFGSVLDLMFKTSGTSMKKSHFYEQVLKSNPLMQKYLGFNSLFLDSKSLDEGFNTKRVFNPTNHIGSEIPVSVLSRRAKKVSDSWDSLVFSLTLLQEGETRDNVLNQLKTRFGEIITEKTNTSSSKLSLMDLLGEGLEDS